MNYAAIIETLLGLVNHHASQNQPAPQQITDALLKAWGIYNQIGALKHGLVQPNSLQNDINDLEQILAGLSTAGVLPTSGPLGNVEEAIKKFASTKAEFEAGQAVSLFAFKYEGKPAHNYAALDGGPGAQALGG